MRLGDLYGFIGFHAYAGSAEEGAASESFVWGIRLTQGMPTSCGRADPIPADYTACRGHLSEADTHLIPIGEGAGFRPEYKIVRSHLMLKYANQLRNHPQFIDVTAEFQNAKG